MTKDFYKDTLGHTITRAEAAKSSKPYYEHPVSKEKKVRLTTEEYKSIPHHLKKHLHPGATPYGTGHDMKHHGEGELYPGSPHHHSVDS